ncbi:chorismate-binding protein [Candidatus Peregrinibacteria bacterium]|nr:MAG: chorismate-binding protein [Candidatus Peregrinibacteria bacterium]
MDAEHSEKNELLEKLLLAPQNLQEQRELLSALFTPAERKTLAERAEIVELLFEGKTHRDIAKKTGASLATISRGSREMKYGNGVFQKFYERVLRKHTCGNLPVFEARQSISLEDAANVFERIQISKSPLFCFESRSLNPIYGRMSLLGIDPILEICGKENIIKFRVCSPRGKRFLKDFTSSGIADQADEVLQQDKNILELRIEKDTGFCSEDARTRRKNIAIALRAFLEYFQCKTSGKFGVYGAFSYDFARLFEILPELLPENDIPDFHFFLFDTFVQFDLLKEKAELALFRENRGEAEADIAQLFQSISKPKKLQKKVFSTKNISADISPEEYENQVETARELARQGEIFEAVFSRKFSGEFSGDPFALYKIYREKNPAPYLFFFDFGESQLVGASPEMMVRVENGKAHLRPISGTRPRGEDPVSDHENMLELLSCEKERAELDMLIDLGRNDLKRVCEPGIEITSYRHVEKYSRVMHTIAHLTGNLRKDRDALDALIACQSAGTLTGAPKVQAMIEIEKTETSRRGFYGGSIGYLTFSGDMDTGIIIRSAHIHNNRFSFRAGATLLYSSIPEDESKEVENKAQALLEILRGEF